MNYPGSEIVAALVEDEQTADRLCASLRRNGVRRGEMDRFALNPAGQHHGLPLGGDADTDAGAKTGSSGAIVGAGLGGAVGAAIGTVVAPVIGPSAIVGGMAAGVYAGSLAGALNSVGAHAEAAHPIVRPPGVMVAVRVTDSRVVRAIVRTMRDGGARFIECACGVWANGRWSDFDPVAPPRVVALDRRP